MDQVSVIEDNSAVRYSGRRSKPPSKRQANTAHSPAGSAVWPFVGAVFIVALLMHGWAMAIGFVAAQLATMTAVQWLVLLVHRNAAAFGLRPFRALPMLRLAKLVTLGIALGWLVMA